MNVRLTRRVGVGAIIDVANGPLGQRTYVFRAADPSGGPALRQLSSVTLRLWNAGADRR
jgi:hypothetical protein